VKGKEDRRKIGDQGCKGLSVNSAAEFPQKKKVNAFLSCGEVGLKGGPPLREQIATLKKVKTIKVTCDLVECPGPFGKPRKKKGSKVPGDGGEISEGGN